MTGKDNKIKQYSIFKLETSRFFEYSKDKAKEPKIIPVDISIQMAAMNNELVKIAQNQLTNAIFNHIKKNGIGDTGLELLNIIVAVVVPPETTSKKRSIKEYRTLAENGFMLNGRRFVRLMSGAGQIRRNTILFIREDFYEPIAKRLMCGLTAEDFGHDFNAAKFNAYWGLNASGCRLLPPELTPNVCIIDDFEQIRPHIKVNHVSEKEVDYISLANGDFIVNGWNTDDEYEVEDKFVTRLSDFRFFKKNHGIHKEITGEYYDEIEDSPALNSFDGQGLCRVEFAERVAAHFRLGFIPSQMIIRAPWVKGMVATMPLSEWFAENEITEVTDAFGTVCKVEDIDIFISKSQWKMWEVYAKKCEKLGVNPWDYAVEQMRENDLLFGIVKTNNKFDDDYKSLNYQYIQSLQLADEDISILCEPMMGFLGDLNSGDLQSIYSNLIVKHTCFIEPEDEDSDDYADGAKLFQRIIEANPAMLNDRHIRELIFRECRTKFGGAKIGKILTRGNYQFMVSDPLAQLQWIAHHHCGREDIQVEGAIPAGTIYSSYWLRQEDKPEQVVLMRSPLIDRNEIAKRKLIQHSNHYFRYLQSGIIYPISDLTTLQQAGADYDGDLTYSTNSEVILRGSLNYKDAQPLYYKATATNLVGDISADNLIAADSRGLYSKVGTISNKSCSLYAKMKNYDENSNEYKKLYSSIVALGQAVGMEVDRAKTAVAPTMPLEWTELQPNIQQTRNQDLVVENPEEEQGIRLHNALLPDIKPYFFKYVYDYIAKAIRQLDKDFEYLAKIQFHSSLDEICTKIENGTATEDESDLYSRYLEAKPTIDNNCIMNQICRLFENFEKDLHRQTLSESQDMLRDFVDEREISSDKISEVEQILNQYLLLKKRLVRTLGDSKSSCKNTAIYRFNSFARLREVYRSQILSLFGGDVITAFNALMRVATSKNTWDILDSKIVKVVKI